MSDPVTYTAVLPAPDKTVPFVSGLLAAERRRRGTRRGRRALGCYRQAVLLLRWFLDGTRLARLAIDNAISTSTAYRYLHEGIDALVRVAPGLRGALLAARAAGHAHVQVDGTLIRTDRCPKLGRKGHGKWWGRYDAPRAADGRRRQEKIGPFITKTEADAALADAVQAISRGTYLRPEKDLTVGRYFDEWLEGKTRLKPSTRHGYQQHLNLYLKPGLGHLRLADLRDVDLEALYAAMRLIGRPAGDSRTPPLTRRLLGARTDPSAARRPLSDATIRRVHATAMSALGAAVKRRKI